MHRPGGGPDTSDIFTLSDYCQPRHCGHVHHREPLTSHQPSQHPLHSGITLSRTSINHNSKTSSNEAEPAATNWKSDPPIHLRIGHRFKKNTYFWRRVRFKGLRGEGLRREGLPEDHSTVVSACASCPCSFRAANPK